MTTWPSDRQPHGPADHARVLSAIPASSGLAGTHPVFVAATVLELVGMPIVSVRLVRVRRGAQS